MAEILINFASKGDEAVLEATKKVTRHVNDLKRIAKTPIDLKIVKDAVSSEDYKRLKTVINSAKDATRDWSKETEKLWREQQKVAAAAERAAKAGRNTPTVGGITGSMMGGGGKGPILPLGNASSLSVGPDPKAFSTKSIDALNKSLGNTVDRAKQAGFQLGFVSRIIAAMAIRSAVREVFNLADAFTKLQNKIKTTVQEDSVGYITKRLYEAAQNSRTSLESITTAFARTTRSVKALGKSQEEVLQFTETLSKAIQVGGSNSVEASNAMIQLSQGMGSGALRGDELRSVLEQLPIVAELIADKMGVPISALRKLGSEGKLTTEVIFDAINEQKDKIDEAMSKMEMTVGQAWTRLRNTATMESAAMAGVMRFLANSIEFVNQHFDKFVIAAESLGAAMTAGFLVKGVMALKDAFMALRLAMLGHPILTIASILAVVGAALIPVIANMRILEDSTLTFSDVWSSTWDEVKATFFEDDINDGIKTVDASIAGLTEETKNWVVELANAADWLVKLTPFGSGNLFNDEHGFKNFAERLTQRINQDADFRETERMIKEAKELMAEDMAQDAGKNTQGPPKPPKTKDPKGQTFAELMEDLTRNREKAAITSDLSADSIESRVAKEWLDAVDKLEDKIANGITPAQSALIEKTIEEKIILEDMLRLREQIQKSIKDEEKAQVDAFVKYYDEWFKFQEAQKKSVLELQEARADREVAQFDKFKGIGDKLDPTQETRRQIEDLEEFNKFARQNGLADWAKLSKEAIEDLKASMRWENSHFETFKDQMNSIFGPGGTLVKGFADAAANAIVMSQSLGDLRKALVEVLNLVQKQALSSLIQLPMNIAMGAITNSIVGGTATPLNAASTSAASGGMNNELWNSLGPKQFASGGYTGNYGINEPAGIVHGQEFVLNADATRRMGRQNLEAINKGATPVAASSGTSITINNNAGVQVEARELSPGDVQVMITKAIRSQAPKVVAGQINDPNSPISRSLQKNIDSGRRKM